MVVTNQKFIVEAQHWDPCVDLLLIGCCQRCLSGPRGQSNSSPAKDLDVPAQSL